MKNSNNISVLNSLKTQSRELAERKAELKMKQDIIKNEMFNLRRATIEELARDFLDKIRAGGVNGYINLDESHEFTKYISRVDRTGTSLHFSDAHYMAIQKLNEAKRQVKLEFVKAFDADPEAVIHKLVRNARLKNL